MLTTFPRAISQIESYLRNEQVLAEITDRAHHSRHCNGQFVGDDLDYQALELLNYQFTVTRPDAGDLSPDQPWADAYVLETLSNKPHNPGEAWKLNKEKHSPLLDFDGQFPHTLAVRFWESNGLEHIPEYLRWADPHGRQAFLPVWAPSDVSLLPRGDRVLPPIIGYQFLNRKDQLHITVLQRSCDYANYFHNDVFVACKLHEYIARASGLAVGSYTHWFSSLHLFRKDWGKL